MNKEIVFGEFTFPDSVIKQINSLLEEHNLKITEKYQGGICGSEGVYTCSIVETDEKQQEINY